MKHRCTLYLSIVLFSLGIAAQSLFAQTVLFEEDIDDVNFTEQVKNIQKTYNAVKVRCTNFDGLGRDQLLTVKTFDGNWFFADFMRMETYDNGSKVWVGKIQNQPHSSVIFGESKGMWSGRIQDEKGKQQLILPLNQSGVYAIAELEDTQIDEGNDAIIISSLRDNYSQSRNSMIGVCDESSTCEAATIDLMLVYTPSIAANYGGVASVEAAFATWVADLNMINTNSGVSHTFNLRHSQEVNYQETTNPSTDLNWVGTDATVSALRDAHGADLVALITDVPRTTYCAYGYLNLDPTNYNADAAFSVISWICAGTNRSLAHEIGHNMGLRHDRFINNMDTPCVESHGYVNQDAFASGAAATKQWRTIMAYDNQCNAAGFTCNRLPYWSNPSLTYGGDLLGSNIQGAEANAAHVIERAACLVKEFKQRRIGMVTTSPIACSNNEISFNIMFPTINGSGNYTIYNSTNIFTASTQVGTITGQVANGNVSIPINIAGPITAMQTTLTIRDPIHPASDETINIILPTCKPPCSILSDALLNVHCDIVGTEGSPIDHEITFDLNPAGNNLDTKYHVTVGTGVITPTSGNYDVATSFSIQDISPNLEGTFLTIADDMDSDCTKEVWIPNSCFNNQLEASISDPCSCTDPLNRKNGQAIITHFHDLLSLTGNGSVILTETNGIMLKNDLSPFQVGDNLGTAAGVFNLDFFHASGAHGLISLTIGDITLNDFEISVCDATVCSEPNSIPTMSQWGLMLFALLILNLCLVILLQLEKLVLAEVRSKTGNNKA